MIGRWSLAAAILIAAALPAMAATDADWNDCDQHEDLDRSIAGCSRVLTDPGLSGFQQMAAFNNRGNAWVNKHDLDRALADFEKAVVAYPEQPEPYNGRGLVLRDKGDIDRAIADFTKAITLNPDYGPAYASRAEAYKLKNDRDRAIADLTQAIRLDPDNAFKHYNERGIILRDNGDLDRALADYNEAIRLDPNRPEAYANRGELFLDLGDLDRALADLNQSIRIDPKSAGAYNNRGNVWRDKHELDRAFADFNESVHLDPNNQKAYANRGDIWRLKGDLDRALADQDQQIRLTPNDAFAHVARGDTYRYKGDLARALADFDQAQALATQSSAPYTGLGLTYEKMGDLDRARAEFEKAVAAPNPFRSSVDRSTLDTAKARLAALKSGAAQPVIPAAPARAASATSIPTPAAAVPAAVGAARAAQGRRVALVIGNSTYVNVPALPNPQKDAAAMAASLRAIGFDVVTLATNQTRDKMIESLRAFAKQAEQADWAMVYYAGHGMEVGGVNYLIPVDARIALDRDIQSEAVPLTQVLNATAAVKKIKLIVLDACRDNPFAPQATAAPAAVAASTAGAPIGTRSTSGHGLAEVKVQGATLVVYAAKDGQVALDGEGGNSPFTVAMVQRIATPGVEINKVFRLVRDDVMEATAGRQEPYSYGSLPGSEDFYFVAK